MRHMSEGHLVKPSCVWCHVLSSHSVNVPSVCARKATLSYPFRQHLSIISPVRPSIRRISLPWRLAARTQRWPSYLLEKPFLNDLLPLKKKWRHLGDLRPFFLCLLCWLGFLFWRRRRKCCFCERATAACFASVSLLTFDWHRKVDGIK